MYTWFALFLLLAIYTSNQIDRSLLYQLSPLVVRDLQITGSEYGLLVGYGFSLVYVLVSLPLSRMADRYSRKWMVRGAAAHRADAVAASGGASRDA